MPTPLAAELSVITEHVGRYREQIADLARTGGNSVGDDTIAALFEAERALRSAGRALQRAATLAR